MDDNPSYSQSPPPLHRSSPSVHDREVHWRRKCSALEDKLNRLEAEENGKPHKKRKLDSPTQPGRGIRRIVDLYHELPDLLSNADKHAAMDVLDPEEIDEIDKLDFFGLTDEQIEDERKERKRCYVALRHLSTLVPGFQDKVNASSGDNIGPFLSSLQAGANDARSDDTSRLKVAVADWLNARKVSPDDPGPGLSLRDKEERGISNDFTGRLLCPIDYNWEDLTVRAKLRDAAPGYDMASNYFLRCLYEDENGNPESPLTGYLKGPLLVRAYRHIFTSPSSASKENGTSKVTSRRRDVASTLRLNNHVTPRSIAYTATQLLFSLNSSREWKQEYAGFYYPSFYNFVIDIFEDAEDGASEDMKELLQWWNSQIFPATKGVIYRSQPRNAMASSQKRLQEARTRRTHQQVMP